MAPRTLFLCRLEGLFLTLLAAALLVRGDAWVVALTQAPGLLVLLGIVMLAAGLALVLAHNRWSGGVPTVIVTLLGWIVLVKGVAMVAVPAAGFAALYDALGLAGHMAIPLGLDLALGLYLTAMGWRRAR